MHCKWLMGNHSHSKVNPEATRREKTILSKTNTNNKPSSSPLASSSLVMRRLCRLSPSFFPSSRPSSSLHLPRSRCFSFSLSRSSWAVQGWSLRLPSSPNNRWSSRCERIKEWGLNTQMYLRVFMFCFAYSMCMCPLEIVDMINVCDIIYFTLNYCGHPARAPFPPPPSRPPRNVRWFAVPPPLPGNMIYVSTLTDTQMNKKTNRISEKEWQQKSTENKYRSLLIVVCIFVSSAVWCACISLFDLLNKR